jgi:hypothetical protein
VATHKLKGVIQLSPREHDASMLSEKVKVLDGLGNDLWPVRRHHLLGTGGCYRG